MTKNISAQIVSLVKQVEVLDKTVADLISHVERLQGGLNYLSAVNEAIVSLTGQGVVQDKIDELHLERLQKMAQVLALNTAKAVEEGKITPSELVAPSSVVVAIERNARGVISNLRAQIAMPLVPELHSLFVGKKAGDTVQVTRGDVTTSYELLEVYEPTLKGLGQDSGKTDALV